MTQKPDVVKDILANRATEWITVDVTQEDIDNGEISSPSSCPIALALQRQFPDLTGWNVLYTSAWRRSLSCVKDHPYYALSGAAQRFIREFDQKPVGGPQAVSPSTFRFRLTYNKAGEIT